MARLYTRDGNVVMTGHPLSIISLVMLSVGGGALLLSVAVVSMYFYHIRQRRKRLQARRTSLAEKVGEPVLMHAPQHVQTAIDLDGMTPAMRLAHASRTADVQRAQRANAVHAEAAYVAAQQWSVPLPSVAISSSGGVVQQQYNIHNSAQQSPRSSAEHSRPSLTVSRPPLPHDSQERIQLARQQSIISQQSHKSQKSHKSITFAEPTKPSKAASAPNAQPYAGPSTSRSTGAMPLQSMPQLPTMKVTDSASQLMPTRSLSPMPAPSILESESYTPVLDLGLEFGKGNEKTTPFHGEPGMGSRDSQLDLDPHSWLASALDSAFNVSSMAADDSMFTEKPRQAPARPVEATSQVASAAPLKHVSKPSVSSVKSNARRTVTSPPPPPASGPPQRFVKPTPGGAARVTVDYYTPYQRRTLHQSDDFDAIGASMMMGNTASPQYEPVEIVNDEYSQPPRPSTQLSGRTSIESAIRAAALFNVMEPALRSSSDTQQRSNVQLARPSDAADTSLASTITTIASSQGRSSSTQRSGDTTAETSIAMDNSGYVSRTSEDDEKRIPITAVDQISPMVGTYTSPDATPTLGGPKLSVSSLFAQPMQRNANLSNVTLVNSESGDARVLSPPPLTKSPTMSITQSRSGFASTLRAKFNMSRPKSATSTSTGTASPKWSQKSPTMNATPAFAPSLELSPALSAGTKETFNSFGPPNLTWNVSTEDVETPTFLKKPPSKMQDSTQDHAVEIVGLGLRRGSDDADDQHTNIPIVKPLNIAARTTARPSHPTSERTRSISSQTSSKRSQDRYRVFPWSRMTGGPSSSAHGHASTLGGHGQHEFDDAEDDDGHYSPRFEDADSPSGSPMRAAIASSAGHASSGHARAIDEAGRWTLNRPMPANPRDSMASSCCDTIASSVTGHSDNQSVPYEHGNAQAQRAKLLQSVQARKQAKQGGTITSTNSASAKPLGFTSHSASLSIDVGSGPSVGGLTKAKENFFGGTLDVKISEPFMSGDGILTPPLTPFQATIGLPDVEAATPAVQSTPKPTTPPPHARIRAPAQTQSSPTAEQRQAERMSKLRPLSLAASHPQAGHAAGPGPRMPMNATRKSIASSRTNSVAHGGVVTASSSYASMAASNSSGSGSLSHQATLSVIRQSVASTHHGIQLPSINYKRVSRGGSTTSSHVMHGPMGAINSSGLSINASPNLPTIGLPSDEVTSRYGNTSTRLKQQGGGGAGATQNWLAASNANLMSSSLDTNSSLSSAALARLSGSSFASHTSVLARFPALANGVAVGVQDPERAGIV